MDWQVKNNKVLIFHNIASSYYKNCLFNALYEQYKNILVVQLAESREIRSWKMDFSDLHYPYKVLFKTNLESIGVVPMSISVLKVLNKENPDIIYVGGYSYSAYWVAVIWGKVFRKVIISEINSNEVDRKRKYLKELVKKSFVRMSDVVVTYGAKSKEYLKLLGVNENKIVIKPNVTGDDYFNKDKRFLPSTLNHKNNILYVCRLSKEKNIDTLIKAFHMAYRNISSNKFALVIVGDGPEEEYLKELVKNLKLENVKFIGFVGKEDISSYYVDSKVFVLPSKSEPWGLVVNEAMMCGLPVVVSSHCGCSLDLVDGNGYVFKPNNTNSLSSILESYMRNDNDISAQRELSLSIISQYTPDIAASKLVGIFDKNKLR